MVISDDLDLALFATDFACPHRSGANFVTNSCKAGRDLIGPFEGSVWPDVHPQFAKLFFDLDDPTILKAAVLSKKTLDEFQAEIDQIEPASFNCKHYVGWYDCHMPSTDFVRPSLEFLIAQQMGFLPISDRTARTECDHNRRYPAAFCGDTQCGSRIARTSLEDADGTRRLPRSKPLRVQASSDVG